MRTISSSCANAVFDNIARSCQSKNSKHENEAIGRIHEITVTRFTIIYQTAYCLLNYSNTWKS